MEYFEKNGKIIPYQIVHKRIKNTYFRVRDGFLKVSCHPLTKKTLILNYINQRFDQIHAKLAVSTPIEPDDQINLWDDTFEFVLSYGKFRYEIQDKIVVAWSIKTDSKSVKNQVYIQELELQLKKIKHEIEETIAKKGLSPLPYKIKYYKSKFGSYHRKNKEISLNSFLARLDPIYLKYVIYHEYAHAIVFNHSKDFYNLLNEFMPNHRVYQKDLKKIAII
ncbi:MAG: M48 family metallopeptidase [Acholeplasmataceae bacterium]|nr:M48 family metallopeptidase [Acholeplasmataceae bacterium]